MSCHISRPLQCEGRSSDVMDSWQIQHMYIYIYIYMYTYVYIYLYIYIYIYTHIVRCLVSFFEAQPTIPRYSEEKCQPCFFCECVKTQDKWDICFLRYLNFMVHFV